MTEEKKVEADEIEWVAEATTREDYINCACTALSAISESNPMTKIDTARKKQIQEKCLDIIAFYVDEMHEEIFPQEEE